MRVTVFTSTSERFPYSVASDDDISNDTVMMVIKTKNKSTGTVAFPLRHVLRVEITGQ